MSRSTRTLLALALSCALAVGAVLGATTAASASFPGPGTQAQTLPSISMSGSIHEGTSTITVTSVDGFQTRTLQDQDPDHTIYYQRIKTRSMLAPSQPTGTNSHNSVLLQEPIGDGSVFTSYEAQPVDWGDCVTREADASTTSESCDLTLTIPSGTPSFTGKLLVQCRQGPGDPANADVPITAIVQTDWLPALDNPCVQSIPVVYTGSSPPPTAAFTASPSGAPHQWNFDGSSSSAVAPASVASYHWTFGDGATQVTTTPTIDHVYPNDASRTASLVVVDSSGVSSASVSHALVAPSLIVNSNGDAPALDAAQGCATGQTVGDPAEPECTLRAAIQSLDAGVGGTKITFALPAGSTTITAATALPDISRAAATIDGTETTGVPTISGSGLHVNGAAGVTIAVSVVGVQDYGVFFDGSPNSKLTASFIGVTPAGLANPSKFGVVAFGSGSMTIGGSADAGNIISGTADGLEIAAQTSALTSLTISHNRIGVGSDDALLQGASAAIGLVIIGTSGVGISGADIENNTIAGFKTNFAILGSKITSPRIADNHIGISTDDESRLGTATTNLRLDGVPGAVVDGNTIAGATFDLLVAGSLQTSLVPVGDEGLITIDFRAPINSTPLHAPLTGTGDTISNNQLGVGTPVSGPNDFTYQGIRGWLSANDLTISGNSVSGHSDAEIDVTGTGARLQVSGNTVGDPSSATIGESEGIIVDGPPAAKISTNLAAAVTTGIHVTTASSGAVITGNTVGEAADGHTASPVETGIYAQGPSATVGPTNTVGFATVAGIDVAAANATVISNRVGEAKFGSTAAGNLVGVVVEPGATKAVIGGTGAANTIVANDTGLILRAAGAQVLNNAFGTTTSGTLGNGTAISATRSALIQSNTIAASTQEGVHVSAGAVVKILHNSIYGTAAAKGIVGAASGPTVIAAARVVHGASARTWLVLHGVPTDAGTIEVFGNATCGDPEGKVPLFTTPTSSDTTRVLSIADRTNLDGLTVTVTTATGTTQFSSCEPSGAATDGDGDGIPDVVEAGYPLISTAAASDKLTAFVADNQKWVLMSTPTAGGVLSNVSPIDDPDPSGHPGATFPLGLIDWTVSGIEPGSFASVNFTLPGTVINSWWKYTANHAPQYYPYMLSSITPYGAVLTGAILPNIGASTTVVDLVPDGGVGDDDGLENGSVRDPSVPALVAGLPTVPPAGTGSTVPILAFTGSEAAIDIAVGLAVTLIGLALLLLRRRVGTELQRGRGRR